MAKDSGDEVKRFSNQGESSVVTPDNEASDRISFLSSFSPAEDKAIRRKVDFRFVWLIGLMYMMKTVRT